MNPRLKPLCSVRNLLALSVTLFVMLGGPALGQEFTLERDQLVLFQRPFRAQRRAARQD